MNIFNRIASKQQNQQTAAREAYVRLLVTLDDTADDAELIRLMNTLGINVEQVQRDHQQVREAMAELEHDAQHDATASAIGPATVKFDAACAARQVGIHELNEGVRLAANARDDAQAEHGRCQQARRHLHDLHDRDPLMVNVLRDIHANRSAKTAKQRR